MATRRMDALFPKRKSSVSSVKGSKALSAASYKIKDPVYSAQDDIGSGAGTLGAADSQPAALVSSGRKDLHEGNVELTHRTVNLRSHFCFEHCVFPVLPSFRAFGICSSSG